MLGCAGAAQLTLGAEWYSVLIRLRISAKIGMLRAESKDWHDIKKCLGKLWYKREKHIMSTTVALRLPLGR